MQPPERVDPATAGDVAQLQDVGGADAAAAVVAITERVIGEIERVIYGKREAVELLWQAVLAGGHVLLEDRPGLGKTRTARTLARVARLDFRRVQFTPDLMPADITGSSVYEPSTGGWSFRAGPVFANLLLADEVNRAPAKTQAALLEAMQERQVTVDGATRRLPDVFIVVATQNPIEFEGTYPLPEAQLDRFLARVAFGYPSPADERRLLTSRAARGREDVDVAEVIDTDGIHRLRAVVERVHVDDDVAAYVVEVVTATRASVHVEVGGSPRASLALQQLARARAATRGRLFVTPDDVKAVAVPTLSHRLVLRPEAWVRDVTAESVIRTCLEAVAAPPTTRRATQGTDRQ